ncbi:phosphatase PAP2 family protein [Eubacteriaceae bacterium ES2]|nr:phosphatase PAP2 family protein [Eubacteriaceae bacterium ES2]
MDLSILVWINSHLVTLWGNTFFIFITNLWGFGIIYIPMSIFLLSKPKHRQTGLIVVGALLIALIVVNLGIKPFFDRPRPFITYPIDLIIPVPHGSSFPSSHTASVFAFSVAYFLCEKNRLRWLLLVFAGLVAFSRLYLFVHYPSDILIGIFIGIACAFFASWLIKKVYPQSTFDE